MADPHSKLSVLVDPPLAEPPAVDELQRRGNAWRRRRAASVGGLAAAVAVLLAGAGMALVGRDKPQTLQTAAPPASTAGALRAPIRTFTVDGQEWTMLATRTADPAICFTLQPATGEALSAGCLTPGAGALQAAAADMRSTTFVFGLVAPDVSVVTLSADGNASPLEILGSGAGFPVNFVGTIVPASVRAVDVVAIRSGREERVSVTLPVHSRAVPPNGGETSPSAPTASSTTVAAARPTPTRPPTTLAPDTPVSTVVPPTVPSTTIAPGGGQPRRVQPVPGATDLRRQPFQSSAPAGAQSVAIRFWGGVEPCSVLGRVDVAETAERVTITLWTGQGPGTAGMACIQLAAYYEVIVQLQAPLGTRTVVDGAA